MEQSRNLKQNGTGATTVSKVKGAAGRAAATAVAERRKRSALPLAAQPAPTPSRAGLIDAGNECTPALPGVIAARHIQAAETLNAKYGVPKREYYLANNMDPSWEKKKLKRVEITGS